MHPFTHHSPKTLPEALDLLAQHNGSAAVIAGGTDLMLQMKAGFRKPETVINVKRLPELKGIAYNDDDGLTLGALTTLRDLTRDPVVGEHYPALAQTAHVMASEQIRSFATLGGNLCNASPSADTAPPLIAMGASVVLVGASGARTLPLDDFFRGPGKSALQPGELLKAITVPPPEGAAIYLKHAPRAYMDIAVVGVAVWLRMEADVCRDARIVLGAVAPTPLRARAAEAELIGHPLADVRIAKAAKTAAGECSPIDDVRGSAWYRKRMVEVLVRRGVDGLVQHLVQKET